jgi:hypothetical protein
MGKTARNELLKLDATTANNTAVGLILAAVLLPVFSLFGSNSPSDLDALIASTHSQKGIFGACGVIAAFVAAAWLHHSARQTISKIED